MKTLAQRLKYAFARANPPVSKSALARACGISKASVFGWFSGDSHSMGGVNLVITARLLNVDPFWLSTGLTFSLAPSLKGTTKPSALSEKPMRTVQRVVITDVSAIEHSHRSYEDPNGQVKGLYSFHIIRGAERYEYELVGAANQIHVGELEDEPEPKPKASRSKKKIPTTPKR